MIKLRNQNKQKPTTEPNERHHGALTDLEDTEIETLSFGF